MARSHSQTVSPAGLLVALGIIYGDIGTSPLYVLKAVAGSEAISHELVLGALSCIFWTLTILTTVKYVLLTLRADNRGEGGIFALYALVRKNARWLLIPGIIGGSALLADGIITPPISVSSAVEGLRKIYPSIPTVPIVLFIITALFSVQHFGTRVVGRSFGPVMFGWFTMLALLGAWWIASNPGIVTALNPAHAFRLLFFHENGFWLLGAVFLCTTGAEALYSDLGHCGRGNIQVSWAFVKTALVVNYLGQGAWMLTHVGEPLGDRNPFFEVMPEWFLIPGIIIATLATIIASQALISGSFTLATEAMRLSVIPKAKVVYPSELKGQIYVPAVNLLLFIGCIVVVLYFRESSNMEAAYGLAITLTMLMTTILFSNYLLKKRVPWILIALYLAVYLSIEGSFLFANLLKFTHGGWFTLLIGSMVAAVMFTWNSGSRLKMAYTDYESLPQHLPALESLSHDTTVPKFATHLVYMTGAPFPKLIESKIVYSLFHVHPKRADVYWFLHVNVLDVPYTTEYEVTTLVPDKVFRIDFNLGFRVEPRVHLFFRKVVEDMAKAGEVDPLSRYESLRASNISGDVRFVVLHKELSHESDLHWADRMTMEGYFLLRKVSLSEESSFGLDTSAVTKEIVPLVLSPAKDFNLSRVDDTQR
ncbi:MAG: KUP/HAK/KT family potassium transporter [Pseudomonadota bacterium]|jgi:KUP system potassium uptake protein